MIARDYQARVVQKTLEYFKNKENKGKAGLIIAPVGCHEKGYKVIKFDGSLEKVENIEVGDLLMGDDGTSRKVLSLFNGFDEMYKITLRNGESFTVNQHHILHLERSGGERKKDSIFVNQNPILDIAVKDYIKLSKPVKTFYKITKRGFDFENSQELPLDPYYLGLWLGDGDTNNLKITNPEKAIVEYIQSYSKWLGLNFKADYVDSKNCYSIRILRNSSSKNELLETFRNLDLIGNKHIPFQFLTSSRTNKLKLLAGLIDTDGYSRDGIVYEITQKSEKLIKDIYYLVSSLELSPYLRTTMKSCTNGKDTSKKPYYRLTFRNCEDLKCIIERKKIKESNPNKDHRRYSFKIEPVGVDEYFGFELDKNNLYLDEKFIVQHNSGKSLISALIADNLEGGTVVLQPSVELLHQNAEKLASLGGTFTIYSAKAKSKEISNMTYATIGSIKKLGKEFRKLGIRNLLIDESNQYPPKKGSMFRTFVDELKPDNVAGLTATACRLYTMGSMQDNYSILNFLTNRIGTEHPYFKNVIDVIQIDEIFQKYWSPIEYELYDFDESTLRLNSTGAEFTEESIKRAVKDQNINNLIYKRVKALNAQGINRNLIFCDSVETAKKLANVVPNSAYVSGDLDNEERTRVIEQFKSGEIYNMFNYGVLTSGFDYPELQTVIIGRPTNSYVTIYQAMGRAVRIHPNKAKALVIDFCNNVKRFGRLEDLSIEFIEGFGWGMFNGNKLLTNTRMGTIAVTKEFLKGELVLDADDDDIKFWFGKHNGKKPKECPLSYLKWFSDEFKMSQNTSEESKRLIFQVRRVLEKEKALK